MKPGRLVVAALLSLFVVQAGALLMVERQEMAATRNAAEWEQIARKAAVAVRDAKASLSRSNAQTERLLAVCGPRDPSVPIGLRW